MGFGPLGSAGNDGTSRAWKEKPCITEPAVIWAGFLFLLILIIIEFILN